MPVPYNGYVTSEVVQSVAVRKKKSLYYQLYVMSFKNAGLLIEMHKLFLKGFHSPHKNQ
jgi:hypothetical protein